MRIAAGGGYGAIRLNSASLLWGSGSPAVGATSSSARPANSSCSLPPGAAAAAGPSFRVDGESLEAMGFSGSVRLGAARSFDLAVAGFGTEDKERGGDETEEDGRRGQGQGKGQGQEKQAEGRRSKPGSPAALLRGDSGSMNASAGVINVEVGPTSSRAG